MKRSSALFAVFLFFFAASVFAQYDWSEIQYHYQTGSIPPPYYYTYDVFISTAGQGNLYYHGGYSSDTTRKDTAFTFTASDNDLKALNKLIKKSKILTTEIERLPDGKTPIGGSLQNVLITLTQDPRLDRKPMRVEAPYFPSSDKDKKALSKIYEKVKSIVPQDVWDALSTLRVK